MDDGGGGDNGTPFELDDSLSASDLDPEDSQDSRSESTALVCSKCRPNLLNLDEISASDLNPEDPQDLRASALCSWCRIQQLTLELQNGLDEAFEEISARQAANMDSLNASSESIQESLKRQNDLPQHMTDLESDYMVVLNNQLMSGRESQMLGEELDQVSGASAAMYTIIRTQGSSIVKMTRETELLKYKFGEIHSEMSSILSDSESNKDSIAKLINAQQTLQQQVEEIRTRDLNEKLWLMRSLETSNQEYLTTIQELRTRNRDLEVYLGLSNSHVEFSDMENELEPELEGVPEKKAPVVDGHPKSWWRRQANKVVKGMATFRQRLKRCLGGKTSKKPVVRLVMVQPVKSNTTFIMHTGMAPVSEGMPPVSV